MRSSIAWRLGLAASAALWTAALGGAGAQAQDGDGAAEPEIIDGAEHADGADAASAYDGADALYRLLTEDGLSLAAATEALDEAYLQWPTSRSRARAFARAAQAAAEEGAYDIAFAWIDWGLREAAGVIGPDSQAISAEILESAIALAVSVNNPVLARDYARAHAALAVAWRDDRERRRAVFDDVRAQCPDIIDNAWIRTRLGRDAASALGAATSSARAPARCRYESLLGRSDAVIDLYASVSWIEARDRIDGVIEAGLDPADRIAREEIARELPVRIDVERARETSRGEGRLAFVRYSRPGADDVAAFAYLLYGGEGTLYVARVSAADWAWPPESLGDLAELGLEAMFVTFED